MHLTVAVPELAEVMRSSARLDSTWRSGADDVRMLIQVVRIAAPTLEEVLAVGVVALLDPPRPGATRISLASGTAVLSAEAKRMDGSSVAGAHDKPRRVEWLDVTDLAADGRNWRGPGR